VGTLFLSYYQKPVFQALSISSPHLHLKIKNKNFSPQPAVSCPFRGS